MRGGSKKDKGASELVNAPIALSAGVQARPQSRTPVHENKEESCQVLQALDLGMMGQPTCTHEGRSQYEYAAQIAAAAAWYRRGSSVDISY